MTQAFNLSQFANNVDSTGKAILTSGQAVTGILPVANGGSGAATFSNGSVLLGSGTSSFGTVAPGTSGNLLVSNGSTWVSQAPSFGVNIQYFTTSTTWTVPAGVNKALVWVFGGGGAAYYTGGVSYYGGYGGYIAGLVTGLTGTITVTVGTGGLGNSNGSTGTAGGTSSFGSYITCTGGSYAQNAIPGSNGTGTLSGATRIRALCGLETAQLTPSTSAYSDITLTGNAQTITTPTNIFIQYGLSSGRGNTTWSTTFLEAPGTGGYKVISGTNSDRNGFGGAVVIQY